ncbi:MAG: flavin reductase family protein [Candidatus Heimdallarchaeota archaeon]|nr:flavin reductase family protein [Candidatus Heimdallarchaeota archaeon]
MAKIEKGPRAAAYPSPAALVSVFSEDSKPNVMTAAWIANICAEPSVLVVGIRNNRYTCELIDKSGCFGVNIPCVKIVEETDYFGVVSGRDHDKLKETGLTVFEGKEVKVPLIVECPINIECRVTQKVKVGSHYAFFGEILKVYYDESMLDESGNPDILLADVIAYGTGKYYSLKEAIASNGFSKRKRRFKTP